MSKTSLSLCTSLTLIVTAQIPRIWRNIGLHVVGKYAGRCYSVQVERTDAARDIESPCKRFVTHNESNRVTASDVDPLGVWSDDDRLSGLG